MRRRVVLAIVLVAAASVVLFALPLAIAVRQNYRDEELLPVSYTHLTLPTN